MSAPDRRRRAAAVIAAVLAAGVAAALCHVWIRMRAVHLGYEIARETHVLDELRQTQRQLRAELAYLKAPDRIERVGRDQLGMAPPSSIRTVRLPRKGRPGAARTEAR
jgi:cell division protein FtsL